MHFPRERRVFIRLPASESGKVLLRCPRKGCAPADFYLGRTSQGRTIAVEHEHWVRRKPGTLGVTCPYCGYDADDDYFRHPDDRHYLERRTKHEAGRFVEEIMDHALRDFERSLKRSLRGGAIQIKMKKPQRRLLSHSRPIPPRRQDLLRNVACNICQREYGVFALALFCPDCGSPHLSVHLQRERDLAEQELASAEDLKSQGNREWAERRLANVHEDMVSVTEKFLRTIFEFVVQRRHDEVEAEKILKKVGTAFQNMARGKKLFESLDIDPFDGIAEEDLAFMQDMLSKRHIVTHNLGLADEKYVSQTGEGRPGRNVSVSVNNIQRYLDLFAQSVRHCEFTIPEFRPPTI
jgi:hypothetical protein